MGRDAIANPALALAEIGAKAWRSAAASDAARWLGLTALMAGLGVAGVNLEVWSAQLLVGSPINAVALACLLLTRTSRWPNVAISALFATTFATLVHGIALPIGVSLSLANVLATVGCAGILRRFLGEEINLARYRDLWAFSLVAGVLTPLFLMVLVNFAGTNHHLLIQEIPRLTLWGVGNSLGYMLLTPVILSCNPAQLRGLTRRVAPQRIFIVLTAYTIAVVLLSTQGSSDLRVLLIPALLWLTFELGLVGANLGLVIQAVVATVCLLSGKAPTTSGAQAVDQLMKLQLGLVLNALCAYPIAAALTHRWRLAESLAQSNASLEQVHKLSAIAEQVGRLGYARYDLVGGPSYFSKNLARMLGETPEDMMRMCHPDDIEVMMRTKAQAVAAGEDYDSYMRVRSPDGGWRSLRGRTTCEKDRDGKVIALVGVLIDVTDLELADQALRASEARYRLLTEHSNDMILQSDPEGRITYVSPAIVSMTGHQPEDVLGGFGENLLHPDDVARAQFRGRSATCDPVVAEPGGLIYQVRHRDGRRLWLETRSAVLCDPKTSEFNGLMYVARDVTERKAMEAELQRKCEEAEAATVAKSEFLANMSHEIRTPLTSIAGFSDLLHQREDLPAEVLRYVDRIRTGSSALLAIVNDILDFSKLNAGQMELDPRPFEPERFIRDTVDLVACQAAEKGLALSVNFLTPPPAWVEADSLRLRQVLMNLLSNAVKFTRQGEVAVEADYDAAAGRLRIAVRDTGQGIPADRRGRLFQRFSQVDSSITRSHGGSGLGLAICKHLTSLMGGSIDVVSHEGQGSVFSFEVAAPQIEAPMAADFDDERDQRNVRPAHILVVDDVSVNRELVRAMLEPFGHTFAEADNGVEAVRQASLEVFDLILMDMQMPGMDGLAASGLIRGGGLNQATPIVALSANVLPAAISECQTAGMNDHIAKPIRPLELLTKVAHWTEVSLRVAPQAKSA